MVSTPLLAQGVEVTEDEAAAEALRLAQRERLERELAEHYRDWTVRELEREERRWRRTLTQTPLAAPRAQALAEEATVFRSLLAQRAAVELTPHLMHRADSRDSEETLLARYAGLGVEDLAWKSYRLMLQRQAEMEYAFEEAFDAGLYDSEIRAQDEFIAFM